MWHNRFKLGELSWPHCHSVASRAHIELSKAAIEHAHFHRACVHGLMLIVTKIMFPVKHMKMHARYCYGCSMERAERELSATDLGTETSSKQRWSLLSSQLAQVLLLPVIWLHSNLGKVLPYVPETIAALNNFMNYPPSLRTFQFQAQ